MTADEHGSSDPMAGEAPVVAALRLAALGWSVVPVHTATEGRCGCRRSPCPSPGKHPRVPWERWMTRTARPTEIEAWWDRWPDANVGAVTGWVSAMIVLDIDPRHGGDETLAALETEEQPLPPTVTGISGGGGRHLYFAHPTHLVPSRPLAAGVDLKAEGGLVVVPPSRHASGGTYRWLADHAPDQRRPAPLPHWLDRRSVAVDAAWAGGPKATAAATIARTADERAEFAALWSDVGVELQPVEFMALCPFHDDHQPSLHIDPGGCRWFCFGCRRGGGIQALRHLVEPDESPPSTAAAAATEGSKAPTLTADVEVGIVGESAHQDTLLALTGGRRTWSGAHRRVQARLEPEDDNPFDPLAVAVSIEGSAVGHLPRNLARLYRPVIEETI
ncbi:MAG: bifunctional DNA primase/polymerase, partial [Acidimicrobiia bacterium]|nr:bifunctional DNA primase/polymerase [Acidimicrobiia bacterium]